ncbi:MAG: CHASE2 domain-containing protein [Myxococcota bacterium]
MGSLTRALRRPFEGVVALALFGLATALLVQGGTASLDRLAIDAQLRAARVSPPPLAGGQPDAVVIAIDPQSLRALPDWPWSRDVHARLVEHLADAGASSIAFDIDFSTPRDAAGDAAFARAMRAAGNVVLASFKQVQTLPGGAELEIANRPAPILAEASAAIGSVHMIVDEDGVVRRGRRSVDIRGVDVPTLAEAALGVANREAANASAEGATIAADRPPVPVEQNPIPTDQTPISTDQTPIRVDYRRVAPEVRTLSVADVLDGRFDSRDVAGRVVFIGATAVEFQDLWPTPVGPARAGVWIQAILLRTLAAEREGQPTLREASTPVAVGLLFALTVFAFALRNQSHARRSAVLGSLAVAVAAGTTTSAVFTGGLLSPVVPLGMLGAQYVVGLERVRSRFGKSLAEREQSLTALQRVGEATSAQHDQGGIGTALALLGDVVDASGVALWRAGESGLDGRRIEWRRRGDGAIGEEVWVDRALQQRRRESVESELASSGRRGIAHYAPLFAGGRPVGVLVVERDREEALDDTALRTIATVGTQVTLSAENLRLIDGLRATFDSSIEAIACAIEARDGYTESHCRRLALFSTLVADRFGLSDEEIEEIRLGALLHDVGKIGIRDEVLLKPDRFTPEERAIMESHTVVGDGIVGGIHGLGPLTRACVRHHHERWDGGGYPDGLVGDAIPMGARIVSVVDVWDALSTARPYKPAFEQDRVLDILAKGRGVQFDPQVVDTFLQVLDEEGEEMLAVVAKVGAVGS